MLAPLPPEDDIQGDASSINTQQFGPNEARRSSPTFANRQSSISIVCWHQTESIPADALRRDIALFEQLERAAAKTNTANASYSTSVPNNQCASFKGCAPEQVGELSGAHESRVGCVARSLRPFSPRKDSRCETTNTTSC